MRIYYAHPRGTYNTVLEAQDIATLEALGFEVLNPNEPQHQANCQEYADVMVYFEELVGMSDALAFRAFEVDNKIGAGCVREIAFAKMLGRPIIEMPNIKPYRNLTIEQTREHQPHIYGK